jgi:trigger factor
MKVAVTDVSPCRRSLAVEVPPAMIDAEFEKALRTYSKGINISGFRQGKVPRQIVAQRFGKEIEQDVVEALIRDCSLSAIKEKGLKPLHSPVLKDYRFERGAGLSFVAEFEVKPDLDPIGYRDIKVERRKVLITDPDVDKAIEGLRERGAKFEGVEGRGIAQGDYILADIRGEFSDGGHEPLSQPEAFFEIGSAGPHPEMTDELKEMTPGGEKTFGISYPKDHPSEFLAGKRVVFTVRVKEIKTRHLPAIDDEFAREVGAGESLEALRTKVREDLTKASIEREKAEAQGKAVEKLLEANRSAEVPDAMVDDQIEGYIEDFMHRLAAQGIDPSSAGVDLDRLRDEQRVPAQRSVKAALLLDAIAVKESMEIPEAEIEEAFLAEARRMKQTPESLRARWKKEGHMDALKRHLMREKVLDLILGPSNI